MADAGYHADGKIEMKRIFRSPYILEVLCEDVDFI